MIVDLQNTVTEAVRRCIRMTVDLQNTVTEAIRRCIVIQNYYVIKE